MPDNSLKPLRRRIDRIDNEILSLISERARIVSQVAQVKSKLGLPIYVPGREREILDRLRQKNRGPLDRSAIDSIFGCLIDNCRKHEERRHQAIGGIKADRAAKRGEIVSIIGVGLIGGSFGLALQKYAPEFQVQGFDPFKPSLGRKAPFPILRDLNEALDAQWVILAMPIAAIERFIEKHGKALRPGTVVMDLASTKRAICELAGKAFANDVIYVGGHPLAGKAVGGFEHADSELFRGRPFVLCPPISHGVAERVVRAKFRKLHALIGKIGAVPLKVKADDHDQMLALTSHLPQVLSTALACTAAEHLKRRTPFYGPAFLEMTRLATSDYAVWKNILESNQDWIGEFADLYQNNLNRLIRLSRNGAAGAAFTRARRFRARLK